MPRLSKRQRAHAQRMIDFYTHGQPKRSLDSIGARRDESEKAIVAALEKVGAKVWRMHQPCDLLVRFGFVLHDRAFGPQPRYHLLDCARKRGPRSPEQLAMFHEWGVAIVETPEQALRVVGAMT
jgi:hypothetical protein